jgi:MFS family permease
MNNADTPSATTLSPLRYRTFAFILIGSLLSNFGNAIQSVGAAWHLTAAHQPADIVALVQSATNLPITLLALPAGAWADMHDRRIIMLLAQVAMMLLSFALAGLAFGGITHPGVIIGLTALLACGVACFNPALSASIGGIVPRAELAAAVALNILAFNVARSLGPAVGGMIVAAGGAKAAFVANALSYFAVILILWRWKPEPAPPVERRPLLAVIGEGFRFAMGSPPIRTIMLRAVTFTATGSAAWALMPLVAADLLGQGSVTYGLLLGALGLGAVFGAATSTWFRRRYSSEAIIRAAGILYGVGCMIVSLRPGLPAMLALLVVSGAGWVQALSGFSVAGQMWSPRPLVGRITAMVSSLTFGGIALGSWLWGHFAEGHGVAAALLASGTAMIVLPLIGLVFPMPRHEAPTA